MDVSQYFIKSIMYDGMVRVMVPSHLHLKAKKWLSDRDITGTSSFRIIGGTHIQLWAGEDSFGKLTEEDRAEFILRFCCGY